MGSEAVASGLDSTAIGYSASATKESATAVGTRATAAYDNSAAFGVGAVAQRANQQMFGNGNNTYTLAGISSAASTAAQTGVGMGVGNHRLQRKSRLRTPTSTIRLATTASQIDKNREGVAMAMAMSGFWVPYGKQFAAGFNVASWDGTYANRGNFGAQVADGLHLTGAVAIGDKGLYGGRVGGVVLLVGGPQASALRVGVAAQAIRGAVCILG